MEKELNPISMKEWIPHYHYDTDPIFEIYQTALKKTNCEQWDNYAKRLRHYSLIQLLMNNIKTLGLNHNIAECGCWKGQSTYEISSVLNNNQFKNSFFVFDSFEGLSEITDNDVSPLRKNNEKKNLKIRQHFSSNYDEVTSKLSEFEFVKFYKGWIPKEFYNVEDKLFQFVHIDVDLYQPTYDSLSFFYERLIPNGIIVCDDYNATKWPGAKQAWDDFLKDKKQILNYAVPLGASFLIK